MKDWPECLALKLSLFSHLSGTARTSLASIFLVQALFVLMCHVSKCVDTEFMWAAGWVCLLSLCVCIGVCVRSMHVDMQAYINTGVYACVYLSQNVNECLGVLECVFKLCWDIVCLLKCECKFACMQQVFALHTNVLVSVWEFHTFYLTRFCKSLLGHGWEEWMKMIRQIQSIILWQTAWWQMITRLSGMITFYSM